MKSIRYILIGLILGGAFGAKVGAYLTQVFEWQQSMNVIEAGFIYGAVLGVVAPLVFSLTYFFSNKDPESDSYSAKSILSGS